MKKLFLLPIFILLLSGCDIVKDIGSETFHPIYDWCKVYRTSSEEQEDGTLKWKDSVFYDITLEEKGDKIILTLAEAIDFDSQKTFPSTMKVECVDEFGGK